MIPPGRGWLALFLVAVLLAHLTLAALPRPVHELEVHTISVSGCPGEDVLGEQRVEGTIVLVPGHCLVVVGSGDDVQVAVAVVVAP